MESETLEEITKALIEINIDDEPVSKKYDTRICTSYPWGYIYKPKAILPRIKPKYMDFEQYVQKNCRNKFQILNRETFHQIKKPIVIFFNHFRDHATYYTQFLDNIYELALKYSGIIEFIAADIIDIDILLPGRNPFNFYGRFVRLEHEPTSLYAIDEQKRTHQPYDAYKTIENLTELCENLLSGKLFPSLPEPENNDTKLVKICVHHNYEELILKSTKNIFLIINLDKYQYSEYEPDYDNIALALKDYNLDIIYMEAENNYIPFEYHANCYPTILYIPYNDKQNFVYYRGRRKEADIVEFLKNIMEKPEFLKLQQHERKSNILQKFVQVPEDFQIHFEELQQFLENNFEKKFKVLDRQLLEKTKQTVILIFMDFQDKFLKEHVEWLNKIYQVVETAYTFLIFIADFNDIDIINSKWHSKDLIRSSQGKPKIFALDRLKHTYELENFVSLSSLFYFTDSVQNGDFYYSQLYPSNNLQQSVKEWTANHFQILLKNTKKDIFLTFYSSDDKKSDHLLNSLDSLAEEVKELNVEIAKFDIKWNYVDLEFAQATYPAQYFIPKSNKSQNQLFKGNSLDCLEMLEFIKSNKN